MTAIDFKSLKKLFSFDTVEIYEKDIDAPGNLFTIEVSDRFNYKKHNRESDDELLRDIVLMRFLGHDSDDIVILPKEELPEFSKYHVLCTSFNQYEAEYVLFFYSKKPLCEITTAFKKEFTEILSEAVFVRRK